MRRNAVRATRKPDYQHLLGFSFNQPEQYIQTMRGNEHLSVTVPLCKVLPEKPGLWRMQERFRLVNKH